MASLPPMFGPEAMVIMVAPTDVYYGLGRMFAITGERVRPNWCVVRTTAEAYKLLGVDSPQFSRVIVE